MRIELLGRVRKGCGEGNILSSGRGLCLERRRKSKIMARPQIETQRTGELFRVHSRVSIFYFSIFLQPKHFSIQYFSTTIV